MAGHRFSARLGARLCVLAMAGCITAGAKGATVTHYLEFLGRDVGVSQSVDVPQFDSSLGTLTQATLNLGASAAVGIAVHNHGTETYANPISGSASGSCSFSATFLGDTILSLSGDDSSSFSVDELLPDEIAGASTEIFSGSTTELYTGSADLAALTGSSTVTLVVSTSGESSFDYTSGLPTSIWVSTYFRYGPASTVATMTYTYIPEPATLSLLAIGSLVVLRRRRMVPEKAPA